MKEIKWNKVNDLLPEFYQEVLVVEKRQNASGNIYKTFALSEFDPSIGWKNCREVVAWKYLSEEERVLINSHWNEKMICNENFPNF